MKPVVAIVGRPNVGKSTLFNRLIGEKRAIVLDTPGVTRDRNYGDTFWEGLDFTVIDTGGFEPEAEKGVTASMRRHALLAIEEADVVIFLMDGRDGLMAADEEVATMLRRSPKPVVYAVNKCDSQLQTAFASEFYQMGLDNLFPVSAEHGRGVGRMLDAVVEGLPRPDSEAEEESEFITRVALLGRPNVGKSTLANRLLGDERMIVDNVAGTTRDAIDSALHHDGEEFLLIDTAGLRRKRGIDRSSSEGYSVMRTLRAIERCHVAVLMIDAVEGITDQDARIIGMANEKGRAMILAVNKWDAVEKDHKTAKYFQEEVERKVAFVNFVPVIFISGLTGQRVDRLMKMVRQVRIAHRFRATTGKLNRWLEQCLQRHHPPVVKGRRLRLYYATQARVAPPTVVISCNDPEAVHFSYQRFLVNMFREAFPVEGSPVRLVFKGKKNPFVDEES